MTFAAQPRRPARPGARRRRGALVPTLVILGVAALVVLVSAQVWTEALWFDQLGYLSVFRTEWLARVGFFLAGFVVMALAVWLNLTLAYRTRPIYPPSTARQASLDHYREQIEPLRRLVLIALPTLLGVFAGGAAAGQWQELLLAFHAQSFGRVDPQFGIDLGFYVFTLPALQFGVSFVMAAVVLSGLAALATHYLYGGVRIGGEGQRVTRQARLHLSVLSALLLLTVAANYWLDRYTLLIREGERFDGASYADVNAVLPAKTILAAAAVIVALVFAATAVRGTWRLPAAGIAVMVVAAVAIGGIYPAIVQRFEVDPNAQELEAEYIQRNIDATKSAFGLDDVETSQYEASTEAEAGALRQDAETTASIRLLDPAIVSPSFRQLQQNKQYYDFADTLSVDRYEVDGESRDTVIGVRELNLAGLGSDQRTWVNDHTVYTHGYGVVAAYGNTSGSDGRPAFYEGGIPSVGALPDYEPRVYFGQNTTDYSIVGAPEGTQPWELDYPDDASPSGQVNYTYTGDGGPRIDNAWTKLLYSIKFGSEQILFSDRVNDQSQILYDRDPKTRVSKVAPYLTLDGRVYPAVVKDGDGPARLKWIVDGYTTADTLPYSSPQALDEATADSLTARSATIAQLQPEKVNYLRNSVKATVDAYDGSVTLYAWDADDPVLKAWRSVFPATVKPMSEIGGDLMSHLRYPEDLFKVQRSLLATYHVGSAAEYYSGQDFWSRPEDPTNKGNLQPPYYLTLQMPGQSAPRFSLTSTYIPGGQTDREVLTAFLAVDAETGGTAGKVSEDYGKLRLLVLQRNTTVPGPGQVQNNIDTNTAVSTTLNLLRSGNSTVLYGNLLTLPVGGGLLYVEPVYVQSSEGTRFPLLRKVLVAFGNEVGFEDTLEEALDAVFGGESGAVTGDDTPPPSTDVPDAPATPGTEEPATPTPGATLSPTPGATLTPTPSPTASPSGGGAAGGTAQERLDAALQRARQAMEDSRTALSNGDFAAYGQAQDQLQQAVEDAIAAEGELGG